MNNRKLLLNTGIIATIAIVGYLLFYESPAFPTLNGPVTASSLPVSTPARTAPERYFNESNSGIAILLKDDAASWLGLAHGLKSVGVPFRIVKSVEQARQHELILVYPSVTGSNTQPEVLQALAEHVRTGNTLIAFSVIGGGMPELFGFDSSTERNDLVQLTFNTDSLPMGFIKTADETTVRLAAERNPVPMPGTSYDGLKHPPIASYSDGTAAITHNFYTAGDRVGHAYAIGIDFGHFALRAHNSRYSNFSGSYANEYHPQLDTLLRFLANVYRNNTSDAIELLTTPYNREFTTLITHDVDFAESLDNSREYAIYEQSQNISATYFMQTKYITDYSEARYFLEDKRNIFETLTELGMEIGSHSVAHSNEFEFMEMGTGMESYPAYRPFVHNFESVSGASISGELRVSKFLLEAVSGQQVISFRPGHLSLPLSLPQMLEATGYIYSSSVSANQVMTHLPYRANFDRNYNTESSIFEFPVTIEDELGRKLGDRLDQAIDVANKIGLHGGLVNILLHPDVLDHKLAFLKGFVETFRERSWFSNLNDFGDWWTARDSAIVSVSSPSPGVKLLEISIEGGIAGLAIRVPDDWSYQTGLAGSRQEGDVVVLGDFAGQAQVEFLVR